MPTSKNFEVGGSGKIHCKVNALNAKIYWKKDAYDGDLPNDVQQDLNGTLTFNNVEFDHRGNYTCYASNDNQQINTSIEVKILPSFEISPSENVEIVEMQSFLLDCKANGFPVPTIKWNYEGKIIDSSTINDERFKIFENSSLLLNEARQEDSGTYACIIGNSAGIKKKESRITIKPMDSYTSFENTETAEGFFFSRAVNYITLFKTI